MNQKNSRTRNYATVVYPESAPDNWIDLIEDLKIPILISPLHNKDVDPQKTPKKPHYHVMLCFDGVKTFEQVKAITETFNGVGLEKIESIRGYARYLCHLDNPEKAQYQPCDVKQFGGLDYYEIIHLPTDTYQIISDMMDYIDENNIISYAKLVQWCRVNAYDWFRVLCSSGTYVIKEYLKSKKWDSDNEFNQKKLGLIIDIQELQEKQRLNFSFEDEKKLDTMKETLKNLQKLGY